MEINKECLVEWKANHQYAEKETLKRPRYVRLRLSDKLDILRRLESGENHSDIAKLYNTARTTISWIKKKRDRILWYSQLQGPAGPETLQAKKMMTNVEDTPFEQALYSWFMEKKNAGESITGPAIQEEALRLNRELGGSADFKASNGWLTRFKKRHGIRQLSLQGVKLGSVDFDSAKSFCDEFEKIIEENQCKPDDIYNSVRTGLQWNALPQKTVDVSTGKILKDRVTLIACVNASGTHKLPMMVVGRSKNPRSFKDFEIPVKYVFHGNGYPNELLFEEWFTDIFLPALREKHSYEGRKRKTILLIDTIPSIDLLNIAAQDQVKVITLPPHVTSIIQPLNQGILDLFKKHYKQSFFNEMLMEKNNKIVNKSDKRWTMKDCCFSIAKAWDSFTEEDFQLAWRKLLKLNELDDRNNQILFLSCGVMDEVEDKGNDHNLYNEVNESMGSMDFDRNSINENSSVSMNMSMEADESSDSVNSSRRDINVKREIDDDTTEETNIKEELEVTSTPSTKDALNAVNTILKWMQNQKTCYQQEILEVMKLRTKILEQITS